MGVFLAAMMQAFDRVLASKSDVPLIIDETFDLRTVYMIVSGGQRMSYNVMRRAIGGVVGFMLRYGSIEVNLEIIDNNNKISNIKIGSQL